MNAEPEVLDLARFNTFKDIARDIVAVAGCKPNRSSKIIWFISSVARMTPDQFDSITVNNFLQEFPDSNFVRSAPIPYSEALVENVCARIEAVVYFWIAHSPIISDLIQTFEASIQAREPPAAEPPMPATRPVAAATPTGGTVGTAVRTRPAQTETIQFNYTYNDQNRDYEDELDEYIRIGELIRSDAGYDNSPIGRLEKIMIEGRPAVEEYLGNDTFRSLHDRLQHAFFAIAAPSYEGKTQSAFAFRTIKPLYFVMSENLGVTAQPIYKNFGSLSRTLVNLGRMDVEHLKLIIPPDAAIDQCISASSLLDKHSNERFYVLGLFQALIIDGVLNDDYDMSWLDYYVTKNRVLEIVPTSINEFLALGHEAISQFCVFMDEFEGIESNVFIRNLARAAKIKVVVSNTNTNVTNLVGRPQGQSRIGAYAWSVVFTKLNSLNWNLLTRMVTDIEDLINYFEDRVQLNERPYLVKFFDHFKTVQVKKVRPGFIHLIIEAMRDFKRENAGDRFNMEKFLCEIVRHLGTHLVDRKPSLESPLGWLATLALFLSNAYGPFLGSRQDLLFHRKAYLEDHFYYLINPVQLSKFCFLTYRPGVARQRRTASTRNDRNDSPPLGLYYGQGKRGRWLPERTIFEQGEVLPFLALMGIWHEDSIFNMLEDANAMAQVSPLTTGSAPNIVQAVPSDGNLLEVFSVVSLVDASHRDMNSSEITFKGQSGESFLTNLIKNLISADDCRDNDDYQVLFPDDGVTGTIISRIHVPYLFPANLPIPAMFSGLSSCGQYHNRSLHFGRISRTKNQEQIDCKFNFFLKQVPTAAGTSARSLNPSQGICTVECKRYTTVSVTLPQLREIFGKAQEKRANLCLLICNSVVSRLNRNTRSFKDFKQECIAQKWEVLRLVQGEPTMEPGQKVFNIERFHPDIYLPDPRDYTMTCLIIELDVINA